MSARSSCASVVFGCALAVTASAAFAQTSPPSADSQTATDGTNATPSIDQLVKLKQNPVSGLRQIVFQANVSPDMPGSGQTLGNYSLQAVWPFGLGDDWRVITYTILPAIQQPPTPTSNSAAGLGDTLINLFITPRKPGAFVWGFGPSILLPTETNTALGPESPALGPAGVLFYQAAQWSAGVVLQNDWTLGGSRVNRVSAFGAQYLLNYNFSDGWYLYSNATITSNWALPSHRWTVPVGGGFGRVFTIGKQAVSASIQAFGYPITPTDGPHWGFNFQFALLFP